jgi:glycine/D-amino acid oxidase-like deaminating enzyme
MIGICHLVMVMRFIDAFNLPDMASQKKRVCVIGAGVSGVVAAVHLRAAGLDVTVFERSSVAGGVWCVGSMSLNWAILY